MGEEMISSYHEYQEYLRLDREALGSTLPTPKLFILDPIWCFQLILRKTEYYLNCKTSLFSRLYTFYLRYRMKKTGLRLGFSIPPNTVGPGLFITHAGPIVIHQNARIGANLRINIDVVIGENNGAEFVPRIGDDVVIEPGAKIFGKIEIADGIHIGANAVVNRSFTEPGVIIAGVPARVIKKNPFWKVATQANSNESILT